jgi:arylsulfatase A-like enzyme
VPPQAQLALAYGAAGAGTKVAVRVARDGAAPKTLFEGAAEGRWTEGAWDLSAFADQAVRIDLVAQGGGVRWGEPRLVVKAPPPAPAAQKKFDRIYIWMVDTLRADKLRVYNPKAVPATPNFDAFANDATRFEWAQVPGTWSLPSHSSILTGVYPSVHKATAHDAKLSAKVPFTTEALKKAGYRTGLFSSNGYVSSKWGFDRSWDESRNFIRESLPNGAEYLWKTAKGFVAANDKKPQFLYLATVEPHVIYNPKKEFLVQYWNKPYSGPIKPVMTGIQLGHIKSGKLKLTETDKAYIKALYDAEVAQADAAFGAFVKDLKAAGTYDSTAIIIISDHGDEFWEHGDVGHAQGVHQELVRVPLIVRAPGLFPSGRVVKADVEAMDIHPTVLRLAGLEPTADVQGSDLLALALDEVANSPRASLTQNLGINRGMKVGRYRLIHTGIGRVGLFDVMKDPLEAKDVADASPIALRQMRNVFGLLLAFEDRWKKASWGTAANVREAFYGQTGS